MTTARLFSRCATSVAVARAAAAYLLLGVAKHVIPLAVIARWSWREPRGPRDREAERRYLAQVVRMRRLLGTPQDDCLQRSLLIYRELSRSGADPVLVIGFRSDTDGLKGHAFVVADGLAVNGEDASPFPFVPTCRFGRHGARLAEAQTA